MSVPIVRSLTVVWSPHITQEQRVRITQILEALDLAPVDRELLNRRKSSRVNVRTSLNGHLLFLPGHPLVSLHTRNLSTSGLGFVTRRPFQRGEQIAIELFMVPRLAKLILAETTFSRYLREGLYEVGCNFVEAVAREEPEVQRSKDHIPARWIQSALPRHAPICTRGPVIHPSPV